MSESGARSNLIKAMKCFDAVAVESPMTGIGIPDINFTKGWIEVKWMRAWPRGADINPVKLDHTLSQEQKIWMNRRWRNGGLVLVAVQISRSWLFYNGGQILTSNWWDNMSRPEMFRMAEWNCSNGLDKEGLKKWIHSL